MEQLTIYLLFAACCAVSCRIGYVLREWHEMDDTGE